MNHRERQALDRYITGNYGEDGVSEDCVLHPDCEAVLEKRDLYSMATGGATADLYDCDGEFVVRVSLGISAFDLTALLDYGRKQRDVGMRLGESELQYRLRVLLNAAPLEPLE